MNFNALYESRKYHNLDDLFANETSTLLDDVQIAPQKTIHTADDILTHRFGEIMAFYEKQGRPPMMDSDDFDEELLAIALSSIQHNAEQREVLLAHDRFGLL